MTWMNDPCDSSIVKPVAVSSLQHSQKGAINKIVWIPSYHKVDKYGRIQSLENDTAFENLSMQFITCSMDGTIAFWDLKLVLRWFAYFGLSRLTRVETKRDTNHNLISVTRQSPILITRNLWMLLLRSFSFVYPLASPSKALTSFSILLRSSSKLV